MTTIRLLSPSDSFEALTDLLHRAYAPLAAQGFRYLATYQDAATTIERCAAGECFVAEDGGRIIGTIAWRRGGPHSECGWYAQPSVAIFGQFAVEPDHQRAGVGAELLRRVEQRVQDEGFTELACDTAEQATHLVRYYTDRGFRRVGAEQWPAANYRSVILSKTLPPKAA